jgi:hypothetical protein
MITDSDIKALKHYFEKGKDVAFAFLFGSQARIPYRLETINRPETIDNRL